jgi:diphthine methyl ester synthase
MLHIIGIGLHSHKDITLRGMESIRESDMVYLETYTSIQNESVEELERAIGKKVLRADRELVENGNEIVESARDRAVSLLVVGSPLFATTHVDMLSRARAKGIKVNVIHNASIISVIGCCGLYSYSFGRTVSIPYLTGRERISSWYSNIVKNIQGGLHTLCLLDIVASESRFMTINEAIGQILEASSSTDSLINEDTRIFAICRFGSPTEEIAFGAISGLRARDFGSPLHSLVIPAEIDRSESYFVEALFGRK